MQLVVGESALISESLSDFEALRVFFELAEERGHSAPSVVVDERGTPVTHPDCVDRMGVPHLNAGAWAFCRHPAAEAFGLPSGTDWVRAHCPHLMFTSGAPYLPAPHLQDQVYLQRFGDTSTVPLAPVSAAGPVAWNNQGSRICMLEERLGHLADNTAMAGFVLWEFDVISGRRRRVAGFPASGPLGIAEVSYSVDDAWIHLRAGPSCRNFLIRVADGLTVRLPVMAEAVGWNPRNGPSAMIAMIPDPDTGRLVIYDYDLAADHLEPRSDIESPTGLPLTVRELCMSADGYSALVTAPVGVSGLDQGARGGVQVAAVIDIDEGSIEPVLPVGFRTRSAQRRHNNPRWCDKQGRDTRARVTVAGHLLEAASAATCEPDSAALSQDLLRRSLEVIDGITAAWNSGRLPPGRFAAEYLQHALVCHDLDETATEHAVSALRQQARTDPAARAVIRAFDAQRGQDWRSPDASPRPVSGEDTRPAQPGMSQAAAARPQGRPQVPAALFSRLIAAESLGDAQAAGREIALAAAGSKGQIWASIAVGSTTALAQRQYKTAATLGLGAIFWDAFYRPELAASGLPPVSRQALLTIVLNSFEACSHLPGQTIIGADAQAAYDAQDTRQRCQQVLARLPMADYITTTPRPRLRAGDHESAAPDPAQPPPAEQGNAALTRKRIFISYVREDSGPVDHIAAALRDNGFDVWLDRTHLVAGMRWKSIISKAIRSGDYFIACFSARYTSKYETYMNEELIIAVERLRSINRSRQWFIPVKLDKCTIPDYGIGPGETLENLQYLDFSQDWDTALAELIRALTGQ